MSAKQELVAAIERLPDGIDMEEAIERIYVLHKLKRGLGEAGAADAPALALPVYRYILDFLGRDPSPEEMARFSPGPGMQERVSALLLRQREQGLTAAEAAELDEYLRIDHLVTMIKARSLKLLAATA